MRTDGFIVAGVLHESATDLRVSGTTAGVLVSRFALTFAMTAPVLAAA